MADAGHLRRNTTNLLVAGAFAEPYFETRKRLQLFLGLPLVSLPVPVTGSALFVDECWIVAGASDGIYGLWAFTGVYRAHVVIQYRGWLGFAE